MKKTILVAGIVMITVSTLMPAKNINAGMNEDFVKEWMQAKQMEVFNEPASVSNITVTMPQEYAAKSSLTDKEISSVAGFKDVKVTHWAAPGIRKAVEEGYVGGYPDNTFRPEKALTRAEFIKMIISARSLEVAEVGKNQKWFDPYVTMAIETGLITKGEFTDYNAVMTRAEMSRVAARSIGGKGDNENQYVLIAVENGIITGKENGNLDLKGQTTRAQSVTVVDRILRTMLGEKLPVDQAALKNAKAAVEVKEDAWGNKIRTTNLPKNHKDFHYILENVPNEAYEMEMIKQHQNDKIVTPASLISLTELNSTDMKIPKESIEDFYNTMFNFDYRTIKKDQWVNKLVNSFGTYNFSDNSKKAYINGFSSNYDWLVKNKVIMEGKAEVYPSMVWYNGNLFARTYMEVNVKSGDTKSLVNIFESPAESLLAGHGLGLDFLFNGKYKMGTKVKFFSDVELFGNDIAKQFYSSSHINRKAILGLNYKVIK